MAEKKLQKIRTLRKVETVRERSEKPVKVAKTRKLHTAKKHISRPFRAAANIGKKEYYLPLPKNKLGNFLNKKRSFVPTYFVNSFKELQQVEWPDRRTTVQLSIAVFVFALFFSLIVSLTDYGLDKIFKQLIIK